MRQRERLAEAKRRGKNAGKSAASWCFDGNTPDSYRAKVQQCMRDGDPASPVQEPAWLSGEWAGESVPELLHGLYWPVPEGQEPTNALLDKNDEIQDAYANAASAAFWREVERGAAVHTESAGAQ